MQNSDPLVWYGTALIAVISCFILIPYLRGKADLPTAWNILLLGLIIFTGIGCFEVKYGDFPWPQLQWFQPTKQEVRWYMYASTSFIVVLMLCYYFNPLARAVSRRVLHKWPAETVPLMLFVISSCIGVAVLSLATTNVFFVGLVLSQLAHKAVIFACVFAFMLWYRNRLNMLWLTVFIGVFIWSCIFAMLLFAGRRLLLSVFFGPVLCVYWTHARYWKPTRSIAILASAAAVILVVSIGYSSFRWFSRGQYGEDRTVHNIVKHVKDAVNQGFGESVMANKLHYFSQWSSHYALLAERYVNNGELEPKPLNTIRFLLSYPIPRSIWPEKPEMIGVTMVRDIVGYKWTNWGIGIAGHGAYEGGIPALVLYAILCAFGIRIIDDPMSDQPGNSFLIAMLATAGPHIVAIPRGDFGNMVADTGEAVLFAILVGIVCRILFGTQKFVQPIATRGRMTQLHPMPPGYVARHRPSS
jgi:hypothetical protein